MNAPDPVLDEKIRASLRARTVQSLKEYLQQADYPRLQMTMMVTLTCFSGFLASWLLLHMGLYHMGWRYGAALLLAYGAFLGMLRVWLHFEGRRIQLGSPDAEDVVDGASELLDDGLPSFRGNVQLPFIQGGMQPPLQTGGGGGGGTSSGGSGGGGGFSFDLDGDELVVIVLVVAALAAMAAAAGYLIYQAPAIFADLMFDGVLSAGLYRRLKKVRAAEEEGEWLPTALRRTAWPFAIVGAMVVAAGFAMHGYAPEARSIGGVLTHFEGRHSS